MALLPRFPEGVRRIVILILPLLALVATVPWWFGSDDGSRLFGLPGWAVYSLVAAAAFAVVLATLLGRCWELSAGSDDDDDAGDS